MWFVLKRNCTSRYRSVNSSAHNHGKGPEPCYPHSQESCACAARWACNQRCLGAFLLLCLAAELRKNSQRSSGGSFLPRHFPQAARRHQWLGVATSPLAAQMADFHRAAWSQGTQRFGDGLFPSSQGTGRCPNTAPREHCQPHADLAMCLHADTAGCSHAASGQHSQRFADGLFLHLAAAMRKQQQHFWGGLFRPSRCPKIAPKEYCQHLVWRGTSVAAPNDQDFEGWLPCAPDPTECHFVAWRHNNRRFVGGPFPLFVQMGRHYEGVRTRAPLQVTRCHHIAYVQPACQCAHCMAEQLVVAW